MVPRDPVAQLKASASPSSSPVPGASPTDDFPVRSFTPALPSSSGPFTPSASAAFFSPSSSLHRQSSLSRSQSHQAGSGSSRPQSPGSPAARYRPLRNASTSSSKTLGRDRDRDRDRESQSLSRRSEKDRERESGRSSNMSKSSSGEASTSSKEHKDREREKKTSTSHPPTSPSTPIQAPKDLKSTTATTASSKSSSKSQPPQQRIRHLPHLPFDNNVDPAPATIMYWSRAPVHGALPSRPMRAHSVTMVDGVAWLFGGCDDKGCWQDVYTFDTETMQWAHPTMQGDIPPPCRAHTATLVHDRKLVVFGGGQGPVYYNSVYVLDTKTRRWTKPSLPSTSPSPPSSTQPQPHPHPQPDSIPAPRRAHTAVLYKSKIWVFGGGNGLQALNDLWTLDVAPSSSAAGGVEKTLRWEQVETKGKRPNPRGYHTANLVGNVMIVVGGSDGRECFEDVWFLNLDTCTWTQAKLDNTYRRLSHSTTQVGSYLFITGGHDGSKYISELLLFNLVTLTYETRSTLGRAPSPRGYHVSLLADGRVFQFGGFNGHDVYDDVYVLDLAGAAYLPQVTSFRVEVE